MFKDDYPATYRAVMAYQSRRKQAAASDPQPHDGPQAEGRLAVSDARLAASSTSPDGEALSPNICVSMKVALPVQSDISISIDVVVGYVAPGTAATPPSRVPQVRATIAFGQAGDTSSRPLVEP